jgi:DNA-binding HxlR family transcriptional regulator
MEEQYEMISLIIGEGALEILQFLAKREVGYFKELRNLKNMRTKRDFSPTTISMRLKELIEMGAVSKEVASISNRNVVAYKITDGGRTCLILADKFENELKKALKNNDSN